MREANKNADGIAVLTDWDEFKEFDWINYIDEINSDVIIFDGRNILEDELKDYKHYFKL